MHFFADHCVPTSVIEALEAEGHELTRLRSSLPTDAPDPEVIAEAGRLDVVLLSLNGDFSDLVRYPPRRSMTVSCRYRSKGGRKRCSTLSVGS